MMSGTGQISLAMSEFCFTCPSTASQMRPAVGMADFAGGTERRRSGRKVEALAPVPRPPLLARLRAAGRAGSDRCRRA